MTDQSRRSRPLGAAAAPRAASPAIAVVIALLAAVVGFFILKQLQNDDTTTTATPSVDSGDSAAEPQDSSSVTVDPAVVATPAPPTTVVVAPGTFRAIVANGSGVSGSAKSLSTLLSTQQAMTMSPATNILDTLEKYETTKVYFEPTFEAQAAFTANLLACGIVVEAMPTPRPVADADVVGVNVAIVLGKDLANAVLKPCTPGAATTPTTVADPAAAAAAVTSTTVAA